MEQFLGSHRSEFDSKLDTWQMESNVPRNMAQVKPKNYLDAKSGIKSSGKPIQKSVQANRWAPAGSLTYQPGRLVSKRGECIIM